MARRRGNPNDYVDPQFSAARSAAPGGPSNMMGAAGMTIVRAHMAGGHAVRQHTRKLSPHAKQILSDYRKAKNMSPMGQMLGRPSPSWGRALVTKKYKLGGPLTKWPRTDKPPRIQRVVRGVKSRAAGRARSDIYRSLGMKRTPYGWE